MLQGREKLDDVVHACFGEETTREQFLEQWGGFVAAQLPEALRCRTDRRRGLFHPGAARARVTPCSRASTSSPPPGTGMMLSVVTIAPGAIVPMHSHPHEQMGYMLSGPADSPIGGITRILGPGDIWRIPGGVPHKVVGLDEGPPVALDVFHPVRDDYR